MTTVVNFFAGPGAGKSTTAAGLFFQMKLAGMRAELVTEFAKDCTYESNWSVMGNQLAVLGEQDRRLRRLVGVVDYIITDSPLLIGLAYAKGEFKADWFKNAVTGAFESYRNVNFFVHAVKPYQPFGRRESEASARAVDDVVRKLLDPYPVIHIEGNERAPERALHAVRRAVG